MKNLPLNEMGVLEMSVGEMMNCGGGGLWSFQTWVLTQLANLAIEHYRDVYESAEATKRMFADHPEIFVK
jgi:hypothetical protein